MLIINNSGRSRPAELDRTVNRDQNKAYNGENADNNSEYFAKNASRLRLHYA